MAIYTTATAIERRLKGRLTTGAAAAFGVGTIDGDLLTQVLDQQEAYINGRLATRYALPVTSSALLPLLAEIAELLVICKVLPIHFANTEESQEGGYGALCCQQGENLLEQILDGDIEADEPIDPGASLANYSGAAKRISGQARSIKWGDPRL